MSQLNCRGYKNKPCPEHCQTRHRGNDTFCYPKHVQKNKPPLSPSKHCRGYKNKPCPDHCHTRHRGNDTFCYPNQTRKHRRTKQKQEEQEKEEVEQLRHYGFDRDRVIQSISKVGTHFEKNMETLLNIVLVDKDSTIRSEIRDNGYQLHQEIGSGSFGTVYKSIRQGKEWAIKISESGNDYRDPETYTLLLIEMGYYYLFGKEGIGPALPQHGPAFFIDTHTGQFSIISQLYTGDVDNLLKKIKTLPHNQQTDNIQHIQDQLENCIDKMLDLGVVCIDMKPANALAQWTETPQGLTIQDVVLTDFGADWCCNSEIAPLCDYLQSNQDFLKTGRNLEFMRFLIFFCFSMYAFYYNRIWLFKPILERFKRILNDPVKYKEYSTFLDFVCDKQHGCGNLSPPFYYLNNNVFQQQFMNYIYSNHNYRPRFNDNPNLFKIFVFLQVNL